MGCSLWGHKESDTTERLCVYITNVTVFSSSLHKIVKTLVLAKKVSTNAKESLPFPSHEPSKQSKQT